MKFIWITLKEKYKKIKAILDFKRRKTNQDKICYCDRRVDRNPLQTGMQTRKERGTDHYIDN